jgi:hypothetical protein
MAFPVSLLCSAPFLFHDPNGIAFAHARPGWTSDRSELKTTLISGDAGPLSGCTDLSTVARRRGVVREVWPMGPSISDEVTQRSGCLSQSYVFSKHIDIQ